MTQGLSPTRSQMLLFPSVPNLVIRASAGTGKTFQLTNRFIELMSRGSSINGMLAATFARKAAGEILDRVLLRLADAAVHPASMAELQKSIPSARLTTDSCIDMLLDLINNLHRIRIGTLDAFFAQLAGSFSLELGFPPGWQIVDDYSDTRLQRQALKSVFQTHSVERLNTLIHLLFKGEQPRSLNSQLLDLIRELGDVFREAPVDAWDCLRVPTPLEKTVLEETIRQLTDAHISDVTLQRARDEDAERAANEDWESFFQRGIAGAIVKGKAAYAKKPLTDELTQLYDRLIDHARAVTIQVYANQTRATFDLLRAFHTAIDDLRHQHRALRFDDITLRLAAAFRSRPSADQEVGEASVGAADLKDVSYRLDGRVEHLLLDEFQDTSIAQWQVIRPFARQAIEGGGRRSVFCVGDVKQAIYRWRGGVAEIFDAVDIELPDIETQYLNESYRSSEVVLDVVNQAFGNLDRVDFLEDFPEVCGAWEGWFERHHAARDKAGYCVLETVTAAEERSDQNDQTLRDAAARIAELTAKHPNRTIGVLVRRNAAVAKLIFELGSRHGIRASEEGGNPLTDSAAVELVLSLLTLADHPGDQIAAFHVGHSPLASILEPDRDAGTDTAAVCRRIRNELMSQGYGATLESWAKRLIPACDQREVNRLLQMVELAHQFDSATTGQVTMRLAGLTGGRPEEFVDFLRAQRVEDASGAKIRVMTVHQAKGLQFDIVVLPELECSMYSPVSMVLTEREIRTEPMSAVCRYLPKWLQPQLPERFQKMAHDRRADEVNEALCLLYVAMTRAVHALYLMVAPSPPRKATFARFLLDCLTERDSAPPDQHVLFETGDPNWDTSCNVPADKQSATIQGLELKPRVGQGRLARQSPSRRAAELAEIDWRKRMSLTTGRGLMRGTLLHRWLEDVEWWDETPLSADDLREQTTAGERLHLDIDVEAAEFLRLVSQSDIANSLSHAKARVGHGLSLPAEVLDTIQQPTTTRKVLREHAFAVRKDDELWQGTIDRLTLYCRAGAPFAADIVDYKSDAIDATETRRIEMAVRNYRPQILAYREIIGRMYGLPAEHITARLLFLKAGRVLDVD